MSIYRVPTKHLPELAALLSRGGRIKPGERWRKLGIPPEAVAWAQRTGNATVLLELTETGQNCAIESGFMAFEFDCTVDYTAEVEAQVGRTLTRIDAPALELAPVVTP